MLKCLLGKNEFDKQGGVMNGEVKFNKLGMTVACYTNVFGELVML
jgi:hypothetical protein